MSETVRFKDIIPQFVVLDVVKTAEYYRDVLGFTIIDYFLDPPVYAMVERDGVELHFWQDRLKRDEGKRVGKTRTRKRRLHYRLGH